MSGLGVEVAVSIPVPIQIFVDKFDTYAFVAFDVEWAFVIPTVCISGFPRYKSITILLNSVKKNCVTQK